MITLTIQLVLAHLLGDFVFQPSSWIHARNRRKFRSYALYLHVIVHLICLWALLGFSHPFAWITIPISHFLVDGIKATLHHKWNDRILFLLDQLAHLVIIAGVVLFYYPVTFDDFASHSPEVLLLAAALVFLTFASGVILRIILSKWSGEITGGKKYKGMSEAGKYIGILERLFIFVFIVLGKWEGVGFLLTAKSIFRFGDLTSSKDHKLTEYILIGSLLSFGIAIGTGLLYSYLFALVS